MKNVISTIFFLAVSVVSSCAADQTDKSGAGTFVSFKDGTLTLKGTFGLFVYKQVGANYKTFQDNENGPGSKLVDTDLALSRAPPGTVFQVNVEDRQIFFGLDYRVIGTFASYQEDGTLKLVAVDVPPGFIKNPADKVVLTIDPRVPVLQSIDGGDYKHAGPAGDVLKTVKPGTLVTARSEYDVDIIEVIQLGEAKRKIERYIGQTRGTVRGTLVSFKEGILRIRGKGVTSLAANEYDRLIAIRISEKVPIVESIDGGSYKAAASDVLKVIKEGTVLTVRKAEEIVLEIQIGVPRKK